MNKDILGVRRGLVTLTLQLQENLREATAVSKGRINSLK